MARSKARIPRPLDEWLACESPWVRYRARQIFLGERAEEERTRVLAHPLVKQLVREAKGWPGNSVADHRSGKDLLNKLTLLAEFGVRRGDAGIDALAERVLAHVDERGRVLNHVVMPRQTKAVWLFDVDGQDPLLTLVALGYGDDERVRTAVEELMRSAEPDGGWVWPDAPSPLPCRRHAGGCPYPTLKIVRLLALDPAWSRSAAARNGVELLLDLADRREARYGFGFGPRFEKLKFPFVWFDILHVLEATSLHSRAWKDARFQRLLARVLAKADAAGRFTPESIYLEWKGQCFAQKNEPSPWLSLVVHRILARAPGAGP